MFGWMRGAVPRGLLRYYVLESLSEKPMSGSELMDEIERRSEGCWRPSPGSIYPLLAWLQDTGHVEEVPRNRAGLRRYRLTPSGRKLLQEERKVWTGKGFFVHPFGPPWHRLPPEKTEEVRKAVRRVAVAFMGAMGALAEEASEEALEGVRRVLEEMAERFEEIGRKLREGRK